MKFFQKVLQRAVQQDASDIHLKVGSPPYLRVDGQLFPQDSEALVPEMMDEILAVLLSDTQHKYFLKRGEIDLSYTEKGVGRFRVNVYRQRGNISVVLRRIKAKILSFDQLNLPEATLKFAEFMRGLVIITGTTGSGKSTTLAAIIDHINDHRQCHVVSIEDPIEYIHNDRKAVVSQREVTIDTESFGAALKSVMRQDPDVILIGEMRDLETFRAAISAAETGHLVFSTLHTTNVMQTIDRIIDLYPSNEQDQIRAQLSINLRAIMCMRLMARADGTGRVPACEIMFMTPGARKLIKDNRVNQLPTAIQQSREDGSQSFNDSLYQLIKNRFITVDDGMLASDNPEELNMMIQGIRLSQSRGGIFR